MPLRSPRRASCAFSLSLPLAAPSRAASVCPHAQPHTRIASRMTSVPSGPAGPKSDARAPPSADVPPGYELRRTPGKGEGVFATRAFERGDTVMRGFILREVEANHSHATQVALDRWVQHGGLNSMVNHSCDPNCGVRLNEQGAYDFVARRGIGRGEEITFDYAMRNYVIEHFPERCMCGARECRGAITGYKDLPKAFKERYKGFVAPYLVELDEVELRRGE